MFITAKEKATLQADVAYLRKIVNELSGRIFQLEGWLPVQVKEPMKKGSEYKWVKEFEVLAPKKRGRPFGSKNKVTK